VRSIGTQLSREILKTVAQLETVHRSSQGDAAGLLGDNAQIAKSGELPPKALVRVDAIRKACLTNLNCAQDCLFTEVEHPVHERPVGNLVESLSRLRCPLFLR
jgi:hypothetical protein